MRKKWVREMNNKFQFLGVKTLAVVLTAALLVGCVGRTGKIGTPISVYYQPQLVSLKLGESTPEDLQKAFAGKNVPVSLKEAKIEGDKKVEIWEIAKGGNMDTAAFIMWGYVAYNKDQQLLFRFENGKLVSYESVVIPDPAPAPAPTAPASKK
jgi:hypothetical protein